MPIDMALASGRSQATKSTPASRSAKIKPAFRARRSSLAISRVEPVALLCAIAAASFGRSFFLPLLDLDELFDDLPPARSEGLRRRALCLKPEPALPLLRRADPVICCESRHCAPPLLALSLAFNVR